MQLSRLRFAGAIFAISSMTLLAACAPTPPAMQPQETQPPTAQGVITPGPEPSVDQGTPLVKLYRHGGLCPTGECQWELVIIQGGAYTVSGASQGVLSEPQMTQLRQLIGQTDFSAIRATPFTEVCPTAYDGQEAIYSFQTSHGEEVVSSCQVVIDPDLPLFQWLDTLVASITR